MVQPNKPAATANGNVTNMNRCLIVVGFLFLAFTAGSALKCYNCTLDGCGDPYSAKSSHEISCGTKDDGCLKVDVNEGEAVLRTCFSSSTSLYANEELKKATKAIQQGRDDASVLISFCEGELCNGSSPLAEIYKMTILLASLVLFTSFFFRI